MELMFLQRFARSSAYVRTGRFRMPFSLFLAYFFHSPKDCLTNLCEGFVQILKKYAVSAYDLAYSPYFGIQNFLALLLEENVCRSMQSPEYGVKNPCMPLERVSSYRRSVPST